MTGRINVFDFDLAHTLECGQAFRWKRAADGWFVGVVGKEVWRLRQIGAVIDWNCSREPARGGDVDLEEPRAGSRLQHYLSLDRSLSDIIATFPADDEPLHAAVNAHWGLRVLRQEPWECLASFMASSTKQIVQIRQIVEHLAQRFGEPISNGVFAFPSISAIASASHDQLWACKLGFRAKNLLAAARMIDGGKIDWDRITGTPKLGIVGQPLRLAGHPRQAERLPYNKTGVAPTLVTGLPRSDYEAALAELLKLPGVGEKIANCVLLFSCGFDQAFPIDVWIERALRRIYLPRRKVKAKQLRDFAHSHFGPHAGWAQQYLFYNERKNGRRLSP